MDTTKGTFLVNKQGFSYWSASGASTQASGSSSSDAPAEIQQYTGELNRDDFVPQKPIAAMSYGGRVRIARLYQNYEDLIGQVIRVGGWAKSTRAQANILFVEINDGSHFKGLQVVVDKSAPGFAEAAKGITGASFIFKGTLIKSPAKGQEFELQVNDTQGHSCTVTGHCDGTYPI